MKYKPGSSNIADYISRHPLKSTNADKVPALETEEYINRIIVDAVPKSLTIEEISEGYKSDSMLLKIMDEMKNKQQLTIT